MPYCGHARKRATPPENTEIEEEMQVLRVLISIHFIFMVPKVGCFFSLVRSFHRQVPLRPLRVSSFPPFLSVSPYLYDEAEDQNPSVVPPL